MGKRKSGTNEIELFWSKVSIDEAQKCWNFQTNQERYGLFYFKDQKTLAHRIAWTLYFGEVPEGKCVCHTCDNTKCCNPNHLFLGSHSDNMQDMWDKNRHSTENMGRPSETMQGERNNNSLLIEDDVITIRSLWKMGIKQSRLAELFDVGRPAIWKIVHRKTWKWA